MDEGADQGVIDYMIYYVYVRSRDEENLEVRSLITMLNEAMEKQARA